MKDKLDAFSIKQQAMTREIITLNDMLASTDALEALYSAKRKELDLNYRNQENALRGQIKALEERIETQREESGKLDKEIDRKQGGCHYENPETLSLHNKVIFGKFSQPLFLNWTTNAVQLEGFSLQTSSKIYHKSQVTSLGRGRSTLPKEPSKKLKKREIISRILLLF